MQETPLEVFITLHWFSHDSVAQLVEHLPFKVYFAECKYLGVRLLE